MPRKNFAIRTVKNGRVKIDGVEYRPNYARYNDELEGMRLAFGRYWSGKEEYIAFSTGRRMLAVWGTERYYRAVRTESEETLTIMQHEEPSAVHDFVWWDEVKDG
jgi:hypothetical protein